MADSSPILPGPGQRPLVPPPLAGYEALRLIGTGGYGQVWLVRDNTGRHFACKVIYRDSFEDDRPYEREFEGIQKFEPVSRANESQVNILEVGRDPDAGYFYYIMELADDVTTGQQINPDAYFSKTLAGELKRRGRIPAGECIRIGLSLSAALENLHEHGLIHRDIKPANIIFVNGIPKLADIGLVSDKDVTVSYVGTEGFIPPEGPGSAPADVYGLGKVLYEMATGKSRLDFPELPTDLGGATEQKALFELNMVVLRACEPNPRKRYQTAGQLHADLTLLSGGMSVQARRRKERRRQTILAVIVCASILLLAAAALIIFRSARQKDAVLVRNTVLPNAVAASDASPRTPQTSEDLARVCIRSGFEALGKDDYAKAGELAISAGKAAADSRSAPLIQQVGFLRSEVARCEPEYQVVAPMLALLKRNPDDPDANQAAGVYLALAKNDWLKALPLLLRAKDDPIRAAAEMEVTQADAESIGEAWWRAAEKSVGDEKEGFEQRARKWYQRAIAEAHEPQKSELKERLAPRLQHAGFVTASLHISSRVGSTQLIDIYPDEIRWHCDRESLNNRINHVLFGDLKDKDVITVQNTGPTRLFPEAVDFSTAKLKIDHKPRNRGNAKLETYDDHVRVVFVNHHAGMVDIEVTVTFGQAAPASK